MRCAFRQKGAVCSKQTDDSSGAKAAQFRPAAVFLAGVKRPKSGRLYGAQDGAASEARIRSKLYGAPWIHFDRELFKEAAERAAALRLSPGFVEHAVLHRSCSQAPRAQFSA